MKTARNLMVLMAVAVTLASASAFADSRHQRRTNEGRFVTVEGRVRDIDRERNGFVIRLRDERLVLFASRDVDGVRRVDRGDVVRVSGTIRGATLYVHRLTILRDRSDRGRGEAILTGIVEDVDARRGVMWVRDARSRVSIRVEVRDEDDLYDVRRGDRVSLRGDWSGNVFIAERVRRSY